MFDGHVMQFLGRTGAQVLKHYHLIVMFPRLSGRRFNPEISRNAAQDHSIDPAPP